MNFRINQSVDVKGGKYAGAAGVILAVNPESGMVQVRIAGLLNGEKVDAAPWLKPSQLEAQR